MTSPPRRRARARLLAAVLPLLLVLPLAGPAQAAAPARWIGYTSWSTNADFKAGRLNGVGTEQGILRITDPVRTKRYADPHGGATRRYDLGRWDSPWISRKHPLTELVPSWNVRTPKGTFVQVMVRGTTTDGRTGSWDVLGNWASEDTVVRRTSLGSQSDDVARVATDTWQANDEAIEKWQLRITLLRTAGTKRSPKVLAVGAMASRLPSVGGVATSQTTMDRRVVLGVRKFSQMTHSGHYPKYGGGGEAWCSPTSTAMVLAYYDALPRAKAYRWVDQGSDRVVDHVARMTYDYAYDGTGNWPFNTAYAATRAGNGFVTRLRSLAEAERFIKAGIPLVTSLTFGSGELDGAPISSTKGHLMVVVGFTASGNVVVNDPAASSNAGVRRTYDRGQFEDAWLKRSPSTGGSGGLTYVIRDDEHPLPARHGKTNW